MCACVQECVCGVHAQVCTVMCMYVQVPVSVLMLTSGTLRCVSSSAVLWALGCELRLLGLSESLYLPSHLSSLPFYFLRHGLSLNLWFRNLVGVVS